MINDCVLLEHAHVSIQTSKIDTKIFFNIFLKSEFLNLEFDWIKVVLHKKVYMKKNFFRLRICNT
jgi:hypothetical protein